MEKCGVFSENMTDDTKKVDQSLFIKMEIDKVEGK